MKLSEPEINQKFFEATGVRDDFIKTKIHGMDFQVKLNKVYPSDSYGSSGYNFVKLQLNPLGQSCYGSMAYQSNRFGVGRITEEKINEEILKGIETVIPAIIENRSNQIESAKKGFQKIKDAKSMFDEFYGYKF